MTKINKEWPGSWLFDQALVANNVLQYNVSSVITHCPIMGIETVLKMSLTILKVKKKMAGCPVSHCNLP